MGRFLLKRYEGESLGYRTLYVWIAEEGLMITIQTNSQ
jgi:D-alanyl-D-alanine carboxypeptidase